MEKYGFIYIWYDKKHKRFYIGCRWGNENDGYICSSSWMKQAYKHRPYDFKRRILSKVYTNKKELLEEEHKWLSKIKDEELGKKYYNLHNHHFGHWSTDENKKISIGEKISLSHKNDPNWGKWNIGYKHTDEAKEKLREAAVKQFSDEKNREATRQKSIEMWQNPEYRKINTENKIGKKQSEEQIQKRTNSLKERWKNQPKKGFKKSDEEKLRIAKMTSDSIWINNGNINRRISKYSIIPDGFVKGRCKHGK